MAPASGVVALERLSDAPSPSHAAFDHPVSAARWNSNLHAFEHLLRQVPARAQRGLDVGCGEGETARILRRRLPSVAGIDPDEAPITEARAYGDDIEYRVAAVETVDLPCDAFDVVSAVAMLHHTEHGAALRRLSEFVAPGGCLLVVGLARSRCMRDYARDARDAISIRRHTLTKSVWDTPAPKIWPPPLSYEEARAASHDVLPEAHFGRLPYFRFGLTWVKKPY